MGNASYTQTSFLGGEISKFAQGQFDAPFYKISLNKLFNTWPTDEGAATRRPGTRVLGTSKLGNAARLLNFDFSEASPYNLELSDGILRMWNDNRLATTNDSQVVQSISAASPAVFTLKQTVTWQTGDTVTFSFSSPYSAWSGSALVSRQFIVTMLSTTTFKVADAVTGVFIGASDDLTGFVPTVNHIREFVTPYNSTTKNWRNTRLVQGYNLGVFLNGTVAPQALQVLTKPTSTSDATFLYTTAQFQDGPYLDPIPNTVATPSALTANVQITIGFPVWSSTTIYGFGTTATYSGTDYISLGNNNVANQPNISPSAWLALAAGSMLNDGTGFVSTDLGRMIRLFSQPPIWVSTTTYAAGNTVTYNGSYFTATAGSNTNNQPDISLDKWVINPSAAVWTWGLITQINSTNQVTVQIQGAPLLYNAPILIWRLGAWSNTTGWPTCGCYQEGRFWFGGAIANRVDSSQPNQPYNMAPTGQDGTVTDASAISYTFNASGQNITFWGIGDHEGIIWGTQEGEFLLTSGTSGAAMTASNIQARRETKYGSSNIQAVRTGLTICFVKRFARRIVEYIADIFNGRFFGIDLTKNARHLGARGIAELAYQEELIPTVWARCDDGSLIGSTYRRNSLFSTQPPEFNGWHQHKLGSERLLESISVGPSVGGTLDALSLVTNNPSDDVRFVEQMTTLQDETAPLTRAWFLDTAVTPPAAAGNVFARFFRSEWTGEVSSGISQRVQAAIANAMAPIVASGSATNPTSLYVGGYENPGSSCSFAVSVYDVTGAVPVLTATYNSATFSASGLNDNSWALDPSGRYIALYLQDASNPTHRFVIFDTQTLTFGTIRTLNLATTSTTKQIAWLDATHLVVDHISGGVRGVEVLSVSGTSITDVGFTGVWGAGSGTSRPALSYANFIRDPSTNGLLHFASDVSGLTFQAIYYAGIVWNGSSVSVSPESTLVSGISPGTGSGPNANFMQTDAATNEWTLWFSTATNYYLMSFTLDGTITRPWQAGTYSFGTGIATFVYYSDTNTLLMISRPSFDNSYRTSTIILDDGCFVVIGEEIPIEDSTALATTFFVARLDGRRFILGGAGGFSSNILQLGITKDLLVQPTSVIFKGLSNYNGKTISVFAAGIDCGDYIVTDGQVELTLGIADPITGAVFNEQTFKLLQPKIADFPDLTTTILFPTTTYKIPCVIGFNYESQGQLCRPQTAQDTGTRTGPGFGKKRRTAMYAVHVVNSIGLEVGTNLNNTKPAPLTKVDAGGQRLNYLDMFSGIVRETLANDYSYDSMLAWKIKRPYPTTVIALGGFIETTDV